MKNKLLSICGLLFFYLGVSAQNNIAVYVVCEDNVPKSFAKVVGTALTNAVNSDGYFVAVERTNEFLQASGSEVSYQNSGAVTQSQILELGKQFGANYVFTVDLSEVLGDLYASSRILNIASNTVEAVGEESANISTLEQLRKFSKNLAQNTMEKLPHNVEKKQIEEYYRNLISGYDRYIPQIQRDFYNYWRYHELKWKMSCARAQEFVKAWKVLGIRVENLVYSIEHIKDDMISASECFRYLLVKYIDKNGNPQECTQVFDVDPKYESFRDNDNGKKAIAPFLFYYHQ